MQTLTTTIKFDKPDFFIADIKFNKPDFLIADYVGWIARVYEDQMFRSFYEKLIYKPPRMFPNRHFYDYPTRFDFYDYPHKINLDELMNNFNLMRDGFSLDEYLSKSQFINRFGKDDVF